MAHAQKDKSSFRTRHHNQAPRAVVAAIRETQRADRLARVAHATTRIARVAHAQTGSRPPPTPAARVAHVYSAVVVVVAPVPVPVVVVVAIVALVDG